MKVDVVAMVLAGGRGTRLNIIAAGRAKPAVPFGGSYRIIDFTLTNIMHSGVRYAGILTQYRPQSLMFHLGDGETWDLAGHTSLLKILPPVFKRADSDWYGGTADAVYQNLDFIDRLSPDCVLILSGDHIYSMDYRTMIENHRSSGADLTIATMTVPWEETHRFGTMKVDKDGSVTEFLEKSPDRVSNIASMGIYVFDTRILKEELVRQHQQGGLDFGMHVIPSMLRNGLKIQSFPFSGYWRDVGTLPSFWQANMDLLQDTESEDHVDAPAREETSFIGHSTGDDAKTPEQGVDLDEWAVRTNRTANQMVFRLPAWFAATASVARSVISLGCRIEGTVTDSVLSPGVIVSEGAVVRDSVIMHDCVIGADAHVEKTILDKHVRIGAGARVGDGACSTGTNERFPNAVFSGLSVIGKETAVPPGARVGTNVIIGPGVGENDFTGLGVTDGDTLGVQ